MHGGVAPGAASGIAQPPPGRRHVRTPLSAATDASYSVGDCVPA